MNEQNSSRDGEQVEKMMGQQGERGTGSGNAMSVNDYQRMRRGYERGIAPEALEQIGAQETPAHDPAPPDGASVEASRRVVRITPEPYIATPSTPIYGPEDYGRMRRSGIGPVAILLIVAVGLIGGLALYAGGADYIVGLFGDDAEESVEELTLVTERPGAELEVVEQTPTPGEMIDMEEAAAPEEELQPEEDVAAAERETRLAAEKIAAEKVAAEKVAAEKAAARLKVEEEKKAAALRADALAAAALKRDQEKRREAQKAREARGPEESTGEVDVAVPVPAATAARYTAQVSATPDRKEAERIAATLRARGGSGVAITTAEKDGVPVYRVRYGSFASEEEARRKSSAIGYGDVWIISLR